MININWIYALFRIIILIFYIFNIIYDKMFKIKNWKSYMIKINQNIFICNEKSKEIKSYLVWHGNKKFSFTLFITYNM